MQLPFCAGPLQKMTRWAAAFILILPEVASAAEQFTLRTQVGQCQYTFEPRSGERHTICTAESYLINNSSSEVFLCRVQVNGDQYVAPSVPETAPDTIVCTRIGQPFTRSGTYDLMPTDDTAKDDKTLNRMRGTFSWTTGFWIYSRNSLELKFCARRLAETGPDYRIVCSKRVEWRK